jgi:hypothetical protein
LRIPVGNTLRAGRGDQVIIRGRLPPDAKLGRLFVFASENGAKFSPYVPNVADILVTDGRPSMLTPLSMRLLETRPERELTFVSDIDGFFCVMQEIDTPEDPSVKIKASRKINPDLSWVERLKRKMISWQIPKNLS